MCAMWAGCQKRNHLTFRPSNTFPDDLKHEASTSSQSETYYPSDSIFLTLSFSAVSSTSALLLRNSFSSPGPLTVSSGGEWRSIDSWTRQDRQAGCSVMLSDAWKMLKNAEKKTNCTVSNTARVLFCSEKWSHDRLMSIRCSSKNGIFGQGCSKWYKQVLQRL